MGYNTIMKKKNKKEKQNNLHDSIETIESMAEAFEQLNYILNNNIPFDIVSEEESEDEDSEEKIEEESNLGFLQDEEDMDDLDFDEMNDVWDEIDEDEN